MNYTIESIAAFVQGRSFVSLPGSMVSNVMIDHREMHWQGSIFIAIKGAKHDGHSFIPALITQGVRHFLVSDETWIQPNALSANFILVKDVIDALQQIAGNHRKHFNIPIIGITGSNGKTIIKEWLNQLLESEFQICRSPKSYNSQIGAALSVCALNSNHTLGVFEAGISKPGEMALLQKMILPTVGVFANLGDAHAAHFTSNQEKFLEKWKLFEGCEVIVCSMDEPWFDWIPKSQFKHCYTWSFSNQTAQIYVQKYESNNASTELEFIWERDLYSVEFPFNDQASVQNAMNCLCTLAALGYLSKNTLLRFDHLGRVAMRMEVKQGIENSVLIDDTYNSDLGSLRAALEKLSQQPLSKRMVILTDMEDNLDRFPEIAKLMEDASVDELVAIGPAIAKHANLFKSMKASFFLDANTFWQTLDQRSLRNKAILIKGARKFRLEQLVQRLQAQQHETYLEIDLHKMGENFRYFKSMLNPGVKTMVMVKAFGYGSGGFEVASYLQAQKADYLAVAYADEGLSLRQRGIHMPIMVMSPTSSTHETLIQNNLEPEIFSIRSLKEFIESAKNLRHLFDVFPIHIKLDSGMHRLGFEPTEIILVGNILRENPFLKVVSIFTHLSASENPAEDAFTTEQVSRFNEAAKSLETALGYQVMKHVLNSNGVLRFQQYQFDMVRIGIGLYGFASSHERKFLHALGAFKSYIIQIREVEKDESVGYNRSGKSNIRRRIATVAVGYADGLDRRLGHGNWSLKWNGHNCPTVGSVCMDMCMIDVSNCEAKEGDEVIVFSDSVDVERMAKFLDTIAYEILTNISQRVRRVYLQE